MFKQVRSDWPKAVLSIQNSVNPGPTKGNHRCVVAETKCTISVQKFKLEISTYVEFVFRKFLQRFQEADLSGHGVDLEEFGYFRIRRLLEFVSDRSVRLEQVRVASDELYFGAVALSQNSGLWILYKQICQLPIIIVYMIMPLT